MDKDKFIIENLKTENLLTTMLGLLAILTFLYGVIAWFLRVIKYFYDKLTKDIEIKFVPNQFISYLKSTRFWQKNLFIKDNKNYYKTNNFIKLESNIEKYPTVSIISKNKKPTSSLQKYYKAKIINYKLIYEQVFNIKPIIQDFGEKEEITTFNQDLIVEIAHFGFDEVSDFEITIVDKIFQSYFETTPKAVGTIKTGQKQRIVLQEAGKLINKDCEELEFENIELNISYNAGQQKFSYNYSLQHWIGYGIKIKFNKKNGFYAVLPIGGMGGSAGSDYVQNLYICHNDFQKTKSKEYIVEINRELSGNQNSGSSEELNFQIIPDKPCQFKLNLSLLDEDQKQCSKIIKRKYKTLFPKN